MTKPGDDWLLNKSFVDNFSTEFAIEKSSLTGLFKKNRYDSSVISKIRQPAERKSWHEYKKIVMRQSKLDNGIAFNNKYKKSLASIEKTYHVDHNAIAAILHIETNYGAFTGNHRVLDSLSTLAFAYPGKNKKRSDFFEYELKQYLLFCKEHGLDPVKLKGSYAGAIGMPQFMPSNIRNLSKPYPTSTRAANLSSNIMDSSASIANFLKYWGWKHKEPILLKVSYNPKQGKFKPKHNLYIPFNKLAEYGLKVNSNVAFKQKYVKIVQREIGSNKFEIGLSNYNTVHRYNNSDMYAFAVSDIYDYLNLHA